MKKLFLLSLILISILVLSQCKKDNIPDDNPSDSTEVEHLILTLIYGYSYDIHGFKNMTYKNGRYDSAMLDNTTIKFTYNNNRLDYYVGPMFGTCCDVFRKKKYHYLNDTLIDYIEFINTYKDDKYEKIELKYNGANQINYYRLYHSGDPYLYYLYDWSADDIAKETVIDYNKYVVPDSVVRYIDTYTYTDTLNPLRVVNDLFFLPEFLTKHLPRNMTRIAYTYDEDRSTQPYTRSLIRVDTLHYHFSYDYNQLGLLENYYRNNKRIVHVLYN